MNSSAPKENLDLCKRIRYCARHIVVMLFLAGLPTITFSGIINLENTLQASLTVRCHDAQTGGFIILGGEYALQ